MRTVIIAKMIRGKLRVVSCGLRKSRKSQVPSHKPEAGGLLSVIGGRWWVIVLLFFLASCGNNNPASCRYQLDDLLRSDKPRVMVSYRSDTLIEAQDSVGGSAFNTYTFDGKGNLKLYAFLTDSSHFKYLEEYDDTGLVTRIGSPLVEYSLFRKDADTVVFSFYLFSLRKKYEDLEVISNNRDTIRPELLYKSGLYTNMKCFSFSLPVAKNLEGLVFFTKGSYTDSCSNKTYSFNDTISFKGAVLSAQSQKQ
jgi:hypothetical protein